MEKIKLNFEKIAQIFGYKYDKDFFSYLKSISKPNNQVCNKEIFEGDGDWKCLDCQFDSAACLCSDCYNKCRDKHINHKVIFMPEGHGYCDCGDPNVIKKEGFCPDHHGPFSNEEELMDFIKSCVDEDLLNRINPLLNNIFYLLIEKIDLFFNKKFENKEDKKIIEDELFSMIDELISFISNIYNNNLGLFYYVTLKFIENFPFSTNHKCFKYNENENKITFIKENDLEKHICICPFFQVLIYVLITKPTKHNSNFFFSLFIQNYKNKIITCISFLHSFLMLYNNSNLSIFRGMDYQLLNEELSQLIHEEKNFDFLENFYIEIYNRIKKLIDLNLYDLAEEIYYNLSVVIKKLPKIKLIHKIQNNIKLFNNIKDIIFLINNLNYFENDINQVKEYSKYLFLCENHCLIIATLISHLFDFNNLESVKFIFNKMITKIIEYKIHKETMKNIIFSPHIVYIRCYSIFLNRFCFNFSVENNTDLFNSFQYFQNIIPNSKEINIFIYRELISSYGFFISQKFSFFKGFNMKQYYNNYFSRNIITNCDITLMKYLLTLPEVQKEFNVDKILEYSNINSCNNLFINLRNEISNKKTDLFKKIELNEINFKYINSIFKFIILVIRDNYAMINLSFRNTNGFKMNYKDNVFEKLLEKEKNNFEKLIENEILNLFLGNKNLMIKKSFIKLYNEFSKYLNIEDIIDNILQKNCEKNISSISKEYSLKKDFIQYCDFDYIIDYEERLNAEEYISYLKPKNFNILNIHIVQPLSIQNNLNYRNYQAFFNKNNNNKFIWLYYILNLNNYQLLTDIFFPTFTKIILFYLKIEDEHIEIDEEFKKNLIKIIRNSKLKGNQKNFLDNIKLIVTNSIKIKKFPKLNKFNNY